MASWKWTTWRSCRRWWRLSSNLVSTKLMTWMTCKTHWQRAYANKRNQFRGELQEAVDRGKASPHLLICWVGGCSSGQKNVRNPNHHYLCPICVAIHLQCVLQCTSNLYCSAFGAPTLRGKGKIRSTPPICITVRLPFVLHYASHSYRSTLGKYWWLWSPGCSPSESKLDNSEITDCRFPLLH